MVVARWLGFEVTYADEQVPRDPQGLRDEASDLLARYLEHLGQVAPVVVLLEDLHWADDASLTWLDAADPVLAGAPVLVVATARPTLLESRPHWGEGLRHHARIVLEPLSRRESRLLLGQLLQHVHDVPRALVDLVVEGAEGNPFYIEELVTWLVDAGVVVRGDDAWDVRPDRIDQVRVPSTLKGVLQSRLDSLEVAERAVLQRASVVGRVFWDNAVAHLGDGAPSSGRPGCSTGSVAASSSTSAAPPRSTPRRSSCSSTRCCATSPTTACCARTDVGTTPWSPTGSPRSRSTTAGSTSTPRSSPSTPTWPATRPPPAGTCGRARWRRGCTPPRRRCGSWAAGCWSRRRTTRCCGSTCSASASRSPTAWPSATASARTST